MARFPFRRSVADDLRDLYQIDRIDRQARTLGYSSISPGDGSLDLINASGTTIARYGDLPGGGFGIGVPDGSGGWRTVQADAQARADAALTTAQGLISALSGRVTTAEGRLDSHASRIGAVENRATTAESRLDSHASRLGNAEGRLDSHVSRIGALEGEVHTARGGSPNLNARIAGVFSYAQALRNYVSNLRQWLIDNGVGNSTPPTIPPFDLT